ALRHCATPPHVINVTGPETISVRWLTRQLADRLGTTAEIVGQEAATALLSDTTRATALFGYPTVPLGRMLDWVADWVKRGGPSLGKPTKFEVRDGTF
ncbi:MAG TPA: epimerase, partial [Caldimonas sp.]|nr:epimerase [Caldimonas sp.]